MEADTLLKNARNILEQEGLEMNDTNKSPAEILNEFILPGLKNSKDTLGSIYSFQTRQRQGFLGKLKNLFQGKIVNTTINVVEKQSMKQQKFNELVFKAIEQLVKENEELRS